MKFVVEEIDNYTHDHNKQPDCNDPFAGFTIHNLFEFFMVFVILTGVAAILLYSITPLLKKMMHGVR